MANGKNSADQHDGGDYLSYGLLAILIVCFGATFYFTALGLEAFSPLAVGSLRFITAAAFLLPIALITGVGLPNSLELWCWAAVLGIGTFFVPFQLVIWAQTKLPTNVIAIFFSSIPLMLLFMSRLVFGITISWRKGLGLLTGSIGLILLAGPGTTAQLDGESVVLPTLATFLACILLASAAILIRLIPKSSPMQMNTGALVIAAIASIPVALFTLPGTTVSTNAVIGVLCLGIISTALGQMVRFNIIRRRGPVFLTPNGYLSAVFAVMLGVLLLDEVLATETLIASGIILFGVLIAQDGTGNMNKLDDA